MMKKQKEKTQCLIIIIMITNPADENIYVCTELGERDRGRGRAEGIGNGRMTERVGRDRKRNWMERSFSETLSIRIWGGGGGTCG